ncbi:MAG TPA: F0F1 ATP synthase subunit A [Steroidobacteraceae bacterium]|jgi:F-type H+-transporting ATPase subunit a|nr:F0F1 ATP synthase subunit A [Steroidobacteraceae bacterium]
MMAEQGESATEYMTHHLGHQTAVLGHWTFNVDTLLMSTLLAVVLAAMFYFAARRARADRAPSGLTLFAEFIYDWVDGQVAESFHGERRFMNALSLALFTWVVCMNSLDLLPADLPDRVAGAFGAHNWHVLPTADINDTFAMAAVVIVFVLIVGVASKGMLGFLEEWIAAPLGKNPLLWIPNIVLNLLELISRPVSLALRLFGNMFAGELLFLLIALFTLHGLHSVGGAVMFFFQVLFGIAWAVFDLLIALLQGYIFMLLPIVYIAMAKEHHG